MTYTVRKIAELFGGRFVAVNPDAPVNHLLLDSRKVIYPEVSLFFAIKGKNHDGHRFIGSLQSAGVRNFVVQSEKYVTGDANFIVVNDSLEALQHLAQTHRAEFSYPVIAITGSNGKTIVKEWLYQLLNDRYRIIRSPKSFNSQVGVPLSLWEMKSHHNLCIVEAGISRPDEMAKLQKMIRPDIGILTNIGDAHSVGFENEAAKIHEKLRLFDNVKTLITRKEDDRLTDIIGSFVDEHRHIRWLNWSFSGEADLCVKSMEQRDHTMEVEADFKGRKKTVAFPFVDDASLENCMHCWLTLLYLDVPDKVIRQNFSGLQAIEMRLKQREGINDCLLIDDYYNADVKSLTLAIDLIEQQHRSDKKTLILSDILQSDLPAAQLYSQVNTILTEKGIDRIIGVGEAIFTAQDLFTQKEKTFYKDTDEFLDKASHPDFNRETILIKGARPYSFERISDWLSKKSHKTVLEINLDAIERNLNYFRTMLKPETRLMVMLKAFGYGSGSHQVARLLQYNRVDYLAVAYADEGVALREAGITTPVMVMNPDNTALATILDNHLQPNIYDLRMLNDLIAELKSRGIPSVQIHLELDTGMHRLGFGKADLPALIDLLKLHPEIKIISVFSHLAVADEESGKAFTLDQIRRFGKMGDYIDKELNISTLKHILNTPGLLNYDQHQMDMVRIGIGIYGIDPSDRSNPHLENVSRLKSYISQIRDVPAGEGISYGRMSAADHDRRIAVIPIGYADGYNRLLSNGRGTMRIKGVDVQVTGSVCMDMTMVDVTGINCMEGDEVIVFESVRDLFEMADRLHTIPYEVLTSVSQRVKREYVRE